jgi:two-component system sensor histidine kinase PilS (NtrC family)
MRFVAAGVAGSRFSLVFIEDISRLQEQAQQMKLAALGRLTANIAHEIRNPLSAITHAGDLLGEDDRSENTRRLVRIIRDNAERLDRMVRDVLELSRRGHARTEAIELREFLSNFLDEIIPKEGIARSAILLEVSGEPTIMFDSMHLNQIMWNLVRNAWRHCSKQDSSLRIRAFATGNRIELHIVDDGPGVDKRLQSQLFEPFFTTYSGGTGLGLYIARELCASNNARLEYIDRSNGADFRISWRLNPQ